MIESAIYTILNSRTELTDLVASRITPGVIEQTSSMPALVFRRLSTERSQVLEGKGDGIVVAEFEVVSVARSYLEAKEVSKQARLALENFRGDSANTNIFRTELFDDSDFYEEKDKLHKVIQDYSFTYAERPGNS